MTYCIVVSRYNESIEWTLPFPNVIIYNKGDPLHLSNEILLTNVGREGHTYYKYICDHYDSLTEYTIFLQGNPFDHSPTILSRLNHYIHTELTIDFEFISETIYDCNLSGCNSHPGLPLIDMYEKIFQERKMDMPFQFGRGAQFIVHKKNILNHPKEFYENIVRLLDYDVNPIEGYVIERFHKLIFK